MGDLIPFGGNMPEGFGRDARGAREIVSKVRLAGIKLHGDAALYGLAFELTRSLNHQRRSYLATDPELDGVFSNMVGNFAYNADHKIQTRHSLFGTL